MAIVEMVLGNRWMDYRDCCGHVDGVHNADGECLMEGCQCVRGERWERGRQGRRESGGSRELLFVAVGGELDALLFAEAERAHAAAGEVYE